jgi:lysophospholipid acyltransferase (LPLAT)-like uncharacterized protein
VTPSFRRRWKQWRRRIGAALLPSVAPPVLRLLSRSWKLHLEGEERLLDREDGGGTLYAMWHGRMLLGMPSHPGSRYQILVSPSADGSLAKLALERFGYGVIRGSSSRQGARALREMLQSLRAGGRVVVTPDGPRGPRHTTNPGLAWMASATGLPLVPVGMVADRAWHLDSWDAFTIAKPFAKVGIVYSEPIHVERRASDERLAEVTVQLRERLLAAEHRACQLIGAQPDW